MKKNVKIIKRYCCPHCLTVHLKDPATQMLCSNADDGLRGVYHLDVVERLETIRCRICQQPIDYQRLIKGDYDYRDWSADGAALVGLILALVLHWIGGLGWWTSVGSGLGAAMALGMVLSHWQKRRIRARTLTR
jgi:hypothetical protein